jgi:hypothetical protein
VQWTADRDVRREDEMNSIIPKNQSVHEKKKKKLSNIKCSIKFSMKIIPLDHMVLKFISTKPNHCALKILRPGTIVNIYIYLTILTWNEYYKSNKLKEKGKMERAVTYKTSRARIHSIIISLHQRNPKPQLY